MIPTFDCCVNRVQWLGLLDLRIEWTPDQVVAVRSPVVVIALCC